MNKLIVYDKNKSYMVFGESTDLKDYPTIPVGATIFIPETKEMLYKNTFLVNNESSVEENIVEDNEVIDDTESLNLLANEEEDNFLNLLDDEEL